MLNLKAKQALGRMLDFYANAIQPDFLAIDRDFPVCRKLAATTDTFEPWQIRQIRKLFLTMKEFESESIRLEKQKMLRLAEVAQWEKQLAEEVSNLQKLNGRQAEQPVVALKNIVKSFPVEMVVLGEKLGPEIHIISGGDILHFFLCRSSQINRQLFLGGYLFSFLR